MSVDHATDLRGQGLISVMPGSENEPSEHEMIAEAWLEAQPTTNTRAAYRRDITEFFDWCDHRRLDPVKATPRDLRPFRPHLEQRYPAAATVARKLATVSSWYVFGTWEFEELIPMNPMSNVKRPPRARQSRTAFLDRDELERLFAAADADSVWSAAFVRMLFYSGARVSELCGATTTDLRVERGHMVMWVRRKGGRPVKLTVGKPAADALRRHLDGREGPLFLGRDGAPLTRRSAVRVIARLVKRAGVQKPITPHGLRHTAATLALDGGEDIRAVQHMLGHESIETTMIYARSIADVDHSPTHQLAALLEPEQEN